MKFKIEKVDAVYPAKIQSYKLYYFEKIAFCN